MLTWKEGVDNEDQFLLCCSILRKMMKWTKKVVLYLINCGLFNSSECTTSSIHKQKWSINSFCLSVVTDWVTDDNNEGSLEPETNIPRPSPGCAGRAPHKDPPKRVVRWWEAAWTYMYSASRKKKKESFENLQSLVSAAHGKGGKFKYLRKFCLVPLHSGKCFTQYQALKSTRNLNCLITSLFCK